MFILTLVSPAMAIILLNMVLQTKYEAMQEIVPSVPETEKEMLIRNKHLPPFHILAEREKEETHYIEVLRLKRRNPKKKVQAHCQEKRSYHKALLPSHRQEAPC